MPASNSYEKLVESRKKLFTNEIISALYEEKSNSVYIKSMVDFEYKISKRLPKHLDQKLNKSKTLLDRIKNKQNSNEISKDSISLTSTELNTQEGPEMALTAYKGDQNVVNSIYENDFSSGENAFAASELVPLNSIRPPKYAKSHPNWKLHRVIIGHTGQVYSVAIDPLNKFFVTGSSDRTIKVWNLASGQLQLTLTGHIMAIRGLVMSDRHPYMFSCSEDKTVKCWDLEKNKAIRNYHGHLSSVYTIDIHPSLDLIATAGRDSSVRIWDIRTRIPVHTLTGHKSSVNKVICRGQDPQIISCSMDSTVKTWDLVAGKCFKTLTYHGKSVRSICMNNKDEFVSGSTDGLKKFALPNCDYLQDLDNEFFKNKDNVVEHGNTILNTMSCNNDGVLFSGADNGYFGFWDWDSGKMFQNGIVKPLPGSLDSEMGILCSSFDKSGLRLITGCVDKSIKIWKEVDI